MSQDRIYFHNLDFIRFVAAYMIVVFHMFYGWQANWGWPTLLTGKDGNLSYIGSKIENGFHNLSLGVDIFFLVSGFLITYLLLKEMDRHGKVNIGKFYMRRVLRIWPLYFLTVAIAPLLAWYYAVPEPVSYLPHLLFVGNFELIANGFSSAALNHLWSICIEEHFYLVCPLLIAFIPRKYLPHIFIGIIAISVIYRGIIVGTDNYWMKMYLHTVSRMDVLAIGCYAGLLFQKGKLNFNHPLIVQIPIYAALAYVYFNDVAVYWDDFFLATFKKYFYILTLGYAAGNFMFNPRWAFTPKKSNFIHYLGKASYGIYMFNPIVVAIFVKEFHKYNYSNGWVFFFGINLLVLLVVVVSYEFFEKPFLKLKDRFAIIKAGTAIR